MFRATYRLEVGDCLAKLRQEPSGFYQTCVTSPPYFGLRDYGHAGQMGLESTPDEYVSSMVEVFREVRRVLRDDGTLWLNLGDSYWNAKGASHGADPKQIIARRGFIRPQDGPCVDGLKPKDLIGIPWRVAFALQADGWFLRQDIIWSKPNPMPEPAKDRCVKSHEYIFLMSKSKNYFFDFEAIQEPAVQAGRVRADQFGGNKNRKEGVKHSEQAVFTGSETRNKRSVWNVTVRPFAGAHFATFPPALIEPCVLAGSRKGQWVIDPFAGSGTTGRVALKHGRSATLIELNPQYATLIRESMT